MYAFILRAGPFFLSSNRHDFVDVDNVQRRTGKSLRGVALCKLFEHFHIK